MKQDLFKYLPSEIINNILLRLPIGDIASSKYVCKSWLDLISTDEFVKSRLSRSSVVLAILVPGSNSSPCTVFELEDDEIDVERSHDHHYNRLTKFNFPHRVRVLGSANGLLLLKKFRDKSNLLLVKKYRYNVKKYRDKSNFAPLYVWNPISREYIKLNCSQGFFNTKDHDPCYGFGATKISGQHKVVRIIPHDSDCHVYTLGTGSWRRVEAACHMFDYYFDWPGAFLNGNLHWLVGVKSYCPSLISCFDLETECFSTFYVSHVVVGIEYYFRPVSVLKDCLCLYGRTSERDDIVDIWLMKEYGVQESWTKEYVINLNPDFDRRIRAFATTIKVFKDGDILMDWGDKFLFYYSNKAKTTSDEFGRDLFECNSIHFPVLFTPSFLSLKSFGMENVISLYDRAKGGRRAKLLDGL